MYLREKLDEKKLIKTKIKELRNNLLHGTSDEIVKVLLLNIDLIQNINLVINKVNQQTMLNIGNTSISITTAVEIRKAINIKINIITELINSNNEVLDILILMEQRDMFMEEYNSINNAIRMLDWSIKID